MTTEHTSGDDARQPPPARIRAVARGMRAFCTVLAPLGPLAVLAIWWDEALWRGLLAEAAGVQAAAALPVEVRLAAAAVMLLPALIAAWALWRLRGFFALVGGGAGLSFAAADRLMSFARGLTVLVLAKPVCGALLSVLVTLPNPPGSRQLVLRFSSDELFLLVICALLVAVVWTLREGARIAREHAEFV